jgi:hypothetical protein
MNLVARLTLKGQRVVEMFPDDMPYSFFQLVVTVKYLTPEISVLPRTLFEIKVKGVGGSLESWISIHMIPKIQTWPSET